MLSVFLAALVSVYPVPDQRAAQLSPTEIACSGCGCRGGPGWRVHSTGKCASHKNLTKECGSPPNDTLCTFENAGRLGPRSSLPPAATGLLAVPANVSEPEREIIGTASVIDADTIEIHGQRIRLFGIDAPEGRQTCRDAEDKEYRCGQVGANALDEYIQMSQPIRCQKKDTDRYNRMVATCETAKGEDVAAWLVRSGHALDWPRYSQGRYREDQRLADQEGIGIWQGQFIEPWEWRSSR
ncbi:thermonuclease family protein [Brucella sp. HL-2]|nr:thermonuclease family protein [Brucella sp. HL-2]MCV9910052.1 thermonuclease family protein [Brucella sp. HL-2]